jgi:hypothetical protein
MGVGYSEPLVQWSSGEYADANNTENDVAVMRQHGLPLRVDDHGSRFASATALDTARRATGIIERRTDVDVFSVRRRCSGTTTVTATPAPTSPNLDIRLRLVDASHATVATSDPVSGQSSEDVATGLDASVSSTLGAGTYYLQVDGVGALTPTTGYSDYGSLGRFSLQISCA